MDGTNGGPGQGREAFQPLDFPLCFAQPLRFDVEPDSTWMEHIPFAMALVEILRPARLVELGVYSGVSYCAFCQAVERLGLATQCFGVDTWQGDEHAGFFAESVYRDLEAYHNPLYGQFSRLVRSDFDGAAGYFTEGSIDLVHLDGLHTYEAARHDWETWRSKLSPQSVMLFHDTNVRERNFGIWKLWEELRGAYPGFEFTHGYGLGVLVTGPEAPHAMLNLAALQPQAAQAVRDFYAALGQRIWLQFVLQRTRKDLEQSRAEHVRALEQSRQLQRTLEETERALAETRASFSYRSGRALTFPLRSLVKASR